MRAYNEARVFTGSNSDADARSFAETRRTLLEALDRTEQEAHDQAAELIRVAERRAREITLQADQNAGLIEEQLTYLTTQLDHVRARVTAIRSRLAHELRADPSSVVPRGAPRPEPEARPAPPAAYTVTPAPVYTDPPPQRDVPAAPAPPPGVPSAPSEDSLPETLRVLRAALESLNGQPANESRGHQS